ncbi:MAG: hypothetical protein ACRC5T_09790 [Cetobacterium sp.]
MKVFNAGDVAYDPFEDCLGLVLSVSGDSFRILILRDDRSLFLEKGEIIKTDIEDYVNKTYRNNIRNSIVKDYLDGAKNEGLLFKKFRNFR